MAKRKSKPVSDEVKSVKSVKSVKIANHSRTGYILILLAGLVIAAAIAAIVLFVPKNAPVTEAPVDGGDGGTSGNGGGVAQTTGRTLSPWMIVGIVIAILLFVITSAFVFLRSRNMFDDEGRVKKDAKGLDRIASVLAWPMSALSRTITPVQEIIVASASSSSKKSDQTVDEVVKSNTLKEMTKINIDRFLSEFDTQKENYRLPVELIRSIAKSVKPLDQKQREEVVKDILGRLEDKRETMLPTYYETLKNVLSHTKDAEMSFPPVPTVVGKKEVKYDGIVNFLKDNPRARVPYDYIWLQEKFLEETGVEETVAKKIHSVYITHGADIPDLSDRSDR